MSRMGLLGDRSLGRPPRATGGADRTQTSPAELAVVTCENRRLTIAAEHLGGEPTGRDTAMNRATSRISMTWLAASALIAVSFTVPAPAAEELRIGFLAPKTGIFAQLGTDMQNGFQMYLDEHNGELGGAKVTLIVE